MKQLTVNIPDHHISAFKEYFSHITDASIVVESDFIITPAILSILDESRSIDNSKYYTVDESNGLLKQKVWAIM